VLNVDRLGVSETIENIPRSGIREIMDAAWQTEGAIALGAGQPDFPTPPHIVAAANEAALAGHTVYVSNSGIPELRSALAEKLRRVNGYDVAPEQIIVAAGGVQALYATFLALLDPGDGILLPDPGWPNFAMMAALTRARIQRYPLTPASDFLPVIEDLERLVDRGTRAILINSPSNPLGSVIGRERMRAIGAFVAKHGLWLISDECYDQTTFDDTFVSAAVECDPARTISIYTFSKTYAMTGWRVGYLAGPNHAISQIAKVQEPLVSCVNAPAQYAALAALEGPQDVVEEMRISYQMRRDEVLARLQHADVPVCMPGGAFYLWADIRSSGEPSRNFALRLLRERKVAVAPGSAFGPGGEGFIRISLATAPELLYEATDRIAAALA